MNDQLPVGKIVELPSDEAYQRMRNLVTDIHTDLKVPPNRTGVRLHIRLLLEIKAAASALVKDVHVSFPEGLDELEGLKPYIDRLDSALIAWTQATEPD